MEMSVSPYQKQIDDWQAKTEVFHLNLATQLKHDIIRVVKEIAENYKHQEDFCIKRIALGVNVTNEDVDTFIKYTDKDLSIKINDKNYHAYGCNARFTSDVIWNLRKITQNDELIRIYGSVMPMLTEIIL